MSLLADQGPPRQASQYIPAVGKILGRREQGNEDDSKAKAEGETSSEPPHRPEHDAQIEEFLRDQYGSKEK